MHCKCAGAKHPDTVLGALSVTHLSYKLCHAGPKTQSKVQSPLIVQLSRKLQHSPDAEADLIVDLILQNPGIFCGCVLLDLA